MVFLRSVCDTLAFLLNTYNQPTIVLQFVTANDAVLSSVGDAVLGGTVMWHRMPGV